MKRIIWSVCFILSAACGSPYKCPEGYHPDEKNDCIANEDTGVVPLPGGNTDSETTAETSSDETDSTDTSTEHQVETDEFGITWVSLQAGVLQMGCSLGDDLCDRDEVPRHTVDVPAFKISQSEITQEQYTAVIGMNPSAFRSVECLRCPVENVLWSEAERFCKMVGGRLPSESEWEYAARGGMESAYVCGSTSSCMNAFAWCNENANFNPNAIKGKHSNYYGLYDVLGNVSEWVQDCYWHNYDDAPLDGSAREWEDTYDNPCWRVARGGSFGNSCSKGLRVSFRIVDVKNQYTGFRCAKNME